MHPENHEKGESREGVATSVSSSQRFIEPLRALKLEISLLLGGAVAVLVAWNQLREQLTKAGLEWAAPVIGVLLILCCAAMYIVRILRHHAKTGGVELTVWIGT